MVQVRHCRRTKTPVRLWASCGAELRVRLAIPMSHEVSLEYEDNSTIEIALLRPSRSWNRTITEMIIPGQQDQPIVSFTSAAYSVPGPSMTEPDIYDLPDFPRAQDSRKCIAGEHVSSQRIGCSGIRAGPWRRRIMRNHQYLNSIQHTAGEYTGS